MISYLSKHRLGRSISYLLFAYLLMACASSAPKSHSLKSAFEQAGIRSILVLPARNNSVRIEAPGTLSSILPYAMAEKGYYVFPVNTVKVVLENEGLYEPSEIYALPADNLARMFDADAILYSTVEMWDTQYVVLAATTVVTVNFTLVSASGETLWSEKETIRKSSDNGSSSNNALADLLFNAIAAAAQRGFTDYRPLARDISNNAISSLPTGPVKTEKLRQATLAQQQTETQ